MTTPTGKGYSMVASDGGIFNFSTSPFAGSLGDKPPTSPVVAVAGTRRRRNEQRDPLRAWLADC